MLPKWVYRNLSFRAVDFARKTRSLSEYKKLRATEHSDIAELEKVQFERLRSLLMHCVDNVPFYRERFGAAGFDPRRMKNVEEISVVPVLSKQDIREHFERFKAAGFESYRPRVKETGGSTGQPLKLYHDEWSHSMMWANIYRGFGHAGYELGDRYLTIASGSMLPKKLKRGFGWYFRLQNSLIFPSYHLDRNLALELAGLIERARPEYIYGYSSVLVQFAREVLDSGMKVSGLKAVFTTADMLFPQQRELIERALGARVYDNYGCPEAGVMTWECSEHDGYHYNMESCWLEVVDPDESGAGRLVSTNLTNYAFPIVRYDTGDIGKIERTGLCPCGRSHSKVKSLLGRQRDIVTLPNGRMVHGAFFNHLPVFYNNERIERFQIIQPAIDRIEVHIQAIDGVDFSEFRSIEKFLGEVFDNTVSVTVAEGGFRESAISRKHRVVISDVPNKWDV